MRRLLVAFVAVAVTVLALAGPASAHAALESTDPAGGSVVLTAPSAITLRFDEDVEIALGAIRLYDGTGHEIDVGAAHHPGGDGTQVQVSVPHIDDGVYVVSWKAVSADSHPVNGAFTFQTGTGDAVADPGLIARLLAQSGGNEQAGAILGVARFLSYAAVAVVAGGLAFLAGIWPGGRRRRRVRVLLWIALGTGVAAGLVAVGAQAPYVSGGALSEALRPSEWWQVLRTRSGRAWGLRVALFGAVGAVLLLTIDRLRARWWQVVGALTALGVFALIAAGGHGATGRWSGLGLLATIAHLGGMAVWIGGLAVLAVGVLREPDTLDSLVRIRRFSAVAAWSVAVIVASGIVQAYRQVGSVDGFLHTDYGRLLLVKTAVVLAIVAVAWVSRRLIQAALVPQATTAPVAAGAAVLDDPVTLAAGSSLVVTRRRLRASVAAELVLAAAVLAITSLLVASVPAVTQEAEPFNATVTQGDRLASITIDPAQPGRNTMHIYITTPGGALDRAAEISVRMTLPERDLGPIPVPVENAGPNHVTTNAMQIPYPGDWQLEVLARFGNTDQIRFATTVPVR